MVHRPQNWRQAVTGKGKLIVGDGERQKLMKPIFVRDGGVV